MNKLHFKQCASQITCFPNIFLLVQQIDACNCALSTDSVISGMASHLPCISLSPKSHLLSRNDIERIGNLIYSVTVLKYNKNKHTYRIVKLLSNLGKFLYQTWTHGTLNNQFIVFINLPRVRHFLII